MQVNALDQQQSKFPNGHPSTSIEEDGEHAEKLWRDWANSKCIKFHKNDQSLETFAHAFKGLIKRTDYEVRVPDLGKIAVDVKSLKFNSGYEDFILDVQEIKKQQSFQDEFKIDVWFAIIPRNGLQLLTLPSSARHTIPPPPPGPKSHQSSTPC